ncbi:hypothetical protein JCM24511_10200 [Saitozyma sp. JCM 24511]|nr:hypothetical protein JCM24511_10200 [Saitozyma sp. JCM 24511]
MWNAVKKMGHQIHEQLLDRLDVGKSHLPYEPLEGNPGYEDRGFGGVPVEQVDLGRTIRM